MGSWGLEVLGVLKSLVALIVVGLFLQQSPKPVADSEVKRVAMAGWLAARALAPKGGAIDLLGPVNARLKELDQMSNISARYAEIAIRAAVSAAQEERDEMQLLLTHARDLSNQMGMAGTPAEWPLPIDELEGELWLEVDRFEEAKAAYERAVNKRPTPNAWIGLARVADKLGDRVTACSAYSKVSSTPGLPSDVELEISLYKLKCQF